jgi:hypothetical protein
MRDGDAKCILTREMNVKCLKMCTLEMSMAFPKLECHGLDLAGCQSRI